jgi:hypothetical protein
MPPSTAGEDARRYTVALSRRAHRGIQASGNQKTRRLSVIFHF